MHLYERVASTSNLGPGKRYFDEANRRAYTTDNLNGKTVEISNTQAAIRSPGTTLSCRGLRSRSTHPPPKAEQ